MEESRRRAVERVIVHRLRETNSSTLLRLVCRILLACFFRYVVVHCRLLGRQIAAWQTCSMVMKVC